ncbi:hypothetical protein HDV03_004175 [Kappamyces sp. JEL0829]|nr:hypothetical protein HDV03_004175 [Kappamyces sp. JEL0829]
MSRPAAGRSANHKRTIAKEFEQEPEPKKLKNEDVVEFSTTREREAKPDLVIPLIKKNQWKSETGQGPSYGLVVPSKKAPVENSSLVPSPAETPELSVEEEAMQRLLNGESAPILAQNAVPGLHQAEGDKAKYLHDFAQRPDDMSFEDYARVPIQDFGAAMLKGMGWKEGTAVGKNPNGLVAPINLTARPALLGLGAKPVSEVLGSSQPEKKKRVLPGDKIELPAPIAARPATPPRNAPESSRGSKLAKGTYVLVVDGSKKGLKGTVVDITPKPDGVAVKLELSKSRDIVRVWEDQVKILDTLEDRTETPRAGSWLRPHIRVRIISKSFRQGEYYNEKCLIQDVVAAGECIVKTGKGVVLDRVLQRHLETVIPPVGKTVMIVQHKDRSLVGQTARLLEYHRSTQTGLVQVDSTLEMESVGVDDMAEYNDAY